ncbi:DNA polymerase III subunit delta [Rickettsiella grylli]|uniref:DNA polymerase III subunit delta n=1 Tax=Rickettsiella grylli TaxID=59196 RepID=A8PLD4_9COXI|nr:DNA polymerase III subunit delta [Rickettsiella grylli]EDP46176.1 DNA polymerase III, delta subunit [Rickettsiella grylli]
MQCHYDQLNQRLNNTVLAPIYWVAGDEIVLLHAACNAIRLAAKKAGFTCRQVFYADKQFNSALLVANMNNYGLFSKKQFLELHLSQGFSEELTKALTQYAQSPPHHQCLLIITGKLEYRLQQTAWFKKIDKIGLIVPLWPLQRPQLILWITERVHAYGLKIEKAAIDYLMYATEGNLLATAQAIEKLRLYVDKNNLITIECLEQTLCHNVRFDPFKLTDAALTGNAKRCLRILMHLEEDGIEPLFILWALSRECRLLASLAFELNQGKNLTTLFKEHALWEKRQHLYQHALTRHSITHWYQLLGFARYIDQLIKGIDSGNVWNALQLFCLTIAAPSDNNTFFDRFCNEMAGAP